jgi:predicted ATPase/class 3 adenylate cyclase
MALPSGIVTFLFTDIEDSTRLWNENAQAMKVAIARHDLIMRECIETQNGRIVKTMGDGLFAVFLSTFEAITAVINCQHRLLAEVWEGALSIRVRMALHSGEALIRDDDYFGTPVNRTARLMSLAAGGQILLSASTANLAREHMPDDVTLIDLGQHHLRGFKRREQVFQLNHPELPAQFPPLKSPGIFPNNLPEQLTSFIGREREVAALKTLLSPNHKNQSDPARLITLTGPGGAGKTRLSIQVAHEMLDEFPDGVFFIGLAGTAEAKQVATTIAVELSLTEQPDLPLADLLGRYLRIKEMLLILDNYEHVMDAAPLVSSLLAAAPRLYVLVTSRELLKIRGEYEFAVHPLQLPRSLQGFALADLEAFEAVALFTQRARSVRSEFRLTEQNAAAVVGICNHLDGMPLAIELAAARIKLFSPEQILERLKDRFRLLKGGARDLPERQRTLRDTIDWSFNLLDEQEQRLFARLAVFRGGRTIDAVEYVCAPGLSFDVLDGLESLLNKSLIFPTEGPEGEPRFLMLETIHEYARDRLAESREEQEIGSRHLEYYRKLAEDMEPGYRLKDQVLLLERSEVEWGNLQAAFNWALDNNQVEAAARLVSSLDYFLRYKERVVQGYRWILRLLPMLQDIPEDSRARFLLAASRLAFVSNEGDQEKRYALQALKLARKTGDRKSEAFALLHLGVFASLEGDFVKAAKLVEEAEGIFRSIDYKPGLAHTFNVRGETAMVAGNFSTARVEYEKALDICRETGEVLRSNILRNNLSIIAYNEGDYQLARKLSIEGLTGWSEIGVRQGIVSVLWVLAGPLAALGEPIKAARLLGVSNALLSEMGAAEHPADLPQLMAYITETRKQLGEVTFEKAWREGQQMTLDEAVAYALEE